MTKTNKKPKSNQLVNHKQAIRKRRPIHKKILLSPASVFILLCIGVVLVGSTILVSAQSFVVTATVPAPALTAPAKISFPLNNSSETTSPIIVSGSCPNNSYIVLIRNGYSSGSAVCQNNSFTIETDLSIGLNRLMAQDYNLTNQAGPSSRVIILRYNTHMPSPSLPLGQVIPAANSPSPKTVSQYNPTGLGTLLLNSSPAYQTFTTSGLYTWKMDLSGGAPPYIVTVNWGDGTTSNLYFKSDPIFYIEHHYSKAGIYKIIVSTIDSLGHKVIFQINSVIKSVGATSIGLSKFTTGSNSPINGNLGFIKKTPSYFWIIWPTYIILILMAFSFWLGERKELKLVAERYELKSKRRKLK